MSTADIQAAVDAVTEFALSLRMTRMTLGEKVAAEDITAKLAIDLGAAVFVDEVLTDQIRSGVKKEAAELTRTLGREFIAEVFGGLLS